MRTRSRACVGLGAECVLIEDQHMRLKKLASADARASAEPGETRGHKSSVITSNDAPPAPEGPASAALAARNYILVFFFVICDRELVSDKYDCVTGKETTPTLRIGTGRPLGG